MFKMHPFLKHKILSKNMRDLLYNTRVNRLNRPKRLDKDFPTTTTTRTTGSTQTTGSTASAEPMYRGIPLASLLIALRRSAEYSGGPSSSPLDAVIKDIEEMKYGSSLKEEGVCSLNGSWTAEVAGRHIEIPDNQNSQRFGVKLSKPVQKHRRGILGMDSWNATLLIPFAARRNYAILTAINYKRNLVATFMGECRVCRSKPIVQGQWFIAHHSRDCESLGTTQLLAGDVWRREKSMSKLSDTKSHRLDMLKADKKRGSPATTSRTSTTLTQKTVRLFARKPKT